MLSNVISNYQKAFGQNFIQDDAYFAIVATLQNVANGLSRIVWGFFYDRKGFQVLRALPAHPWTVNLKSLTSNHWSYSSVYSSSAVSALALLFPLLTWPYWSQTRSVQRSFLPLTSLAFSASSLAHLPASQLSSMRHLDTSTALGTTVPSSHRRLVRISRVSQGAYCIVPFHTVFLQLDIAAHHSDRLWHCWLHWDVPHHWSHRSFRYYHKCNGPGHFHYWSVRRYGGRPHLPRHCHLGKVPAQVWEVICIMCPGATQPGQRRASRAQSTLYEYEELVESYSPLHKDKDWKTIQI